MRHILRSVLVLFLTSPIAMAQIERPQMEDEDPTAQNSTTNSHHQWTFSRYGGSGSWSFINDYPGEMRGLYGGSVYVVVNDTPRVMVFGGYNDSTTSYSSDVWSWNTITGTWTQKTSMPEDRYYHHVAAVAGKVYIISGAANAGSTTPTDTTWEYDPVADTYTLKAPCLAPRNWGGIGVYADQLIYLVGGSSTGTATYINDVLVYEPAFDLWYQTTNTGTVFTPRRSASVSVVNGPDSSFLVVAGGFGASPTFKPDAFEAKIDPNDPLTLHWVQIPDIPAVGLPGGTFNGISRTAGATYERYHLVIGGQLSFTPADTVFRYSKQIHAWNTVTKTWSRWPDKGWGSSNMMYDAASPQGDLWQIGTYGTPSGGTEVVAAGSRISEHFASSTSVGEGRDGLPAGYHLAQNYPNPFNPTTTLAYSLPVSSIVSLKVYDILGREIATLVEGMQPAGTHYAIWDASDAPSGVYYYRLRAGNFSATRNLMLLK